MKHAAFGTLILSFLSSVRGLSIDTPLNIRQCETASITWSSGTSPYSTVIYSAFDIETPLVILEKTNNLYTTWMVNISDGESIIISVEDSVGSSAYSLNISISMGDSTSCLTSSSEYESTTAPAFTSSAAAILEVTSSATRTTLSSSKSSIHKSSTSISTSVSSASAVSSSAIDEQETSKKQKVKVGVLSGGICLLVGVVVFLILRYRRRRKMGQVSETGAQKIIFSRFRRSRLAVAPYPQAGEDPFADIHAPALQNIGALYSPSSPSPSPSRSSSLLERDSPSESYSVVANSELSVPPEGSVRNTSSNTVTEPTTTRAHHITHTHTRADDKARPTQAEMWREIRVRQNSHAASSSRECPRSPITSMPLATVTSTDTDIEAGEGGAEPDLRRQVESMRAEIERLRSQRQPVWTSDADDEAPPGYVA